ncbi:conserved exported hypothetical protein [Candidatus Terasakiella magnetica]|uniref:J domain-containing protein n=1 Tax=Candidatus Terasakiella magnetica TaxID=1867952 RepID=A0A1C3RD63_9PROT|nr:J domain-containing protein [Candidatus Terasakiella magnetica]SCA55217.1 conserved exported hypothetical protein [Candidatus Terasakiella magnetica]
MFHLLFILLILAFFYVLVKWYVQARPRDVLTVAKWIGIIFVSLLIIRLLFSGKFWLAMAALPALFVWFERFRTLFHIGKTVRGWYKGEAPSQQQAPPPPPQQEGRSFMSREEALDLFGLEEDATAPEIKAAYHRLIAQVHPDKGGSDYLAAKINQAKDILLNG